MNENNHNEMFTKETDPLYEEVRTKITQGKRIPYREYLSRRAIHYIEHVADEHELSDLRTALKNRLNL